MLNIDPSTYVVPADQALLYSVVENETTHYKYRLTTGEPGDVTLNILGGLGIATTDLPCLVYADDLLDIISDQSTLDGRTIAVSTHAIAKYVKRFFTPKYDFLTKLAMMGKDNSDHAADAVKHITAAERTTWNAKISDVKVVGTLLSRSVDGTEITISADKTIWTTDIILNDIEGYTLPEGADENSILSTFNFEHAYEFFNALEKVSLPEECMVVGKITAQDLPDSLADANIIVLKQSNTAQHHYYVYILDVATNGLYYAHVSAVNSVYSSITWTKVASTTYVDDAKTTAISTAAGDATSKANAAQAAAEATAAADATSKAATAKAEAIAAAAEDATSKANAAQAAAEATASADATSKANAAQSAAEATAAADATAKATAAQEAAIDEVRKYTIIEENTTSTLVDGMWYILNGGKLTGTLPVTDSTYPLIKISIQENSAGNGSTIAAPSGYTINGSTEALALDASLTITLVLSGHDWLIVKD